MEHVAIMKKSWKLIDKIVSGEKRVESRWYHSRSAPWDRIKPGETVYFKDAGGPVTAKATVAKVEQYSDLKESRIRALVDRYGGSGGLGLSSKELFGWAKKKKYCILIFLKDAKAVTPFDIDKTGFGNACAWMCVRTLAEY
jgi:ASC-1-like (ASCH) protein